MQQSPEATVPTIMSKWSCYWSAAQRSALTQLRLIIQVKYTQVGALKKCKKSIKGLREFYKKAMSVANTSNWFSKFDSSSVVLGTTPKRTEKWGYIPQNICSWPSTLTLKSTRLPNSFSPTPHPTLVFTFSHCCYIFFPCWSLYFLTTMRVGAKSVAGLAFPVRSRE